jgi:hypothetical protein
LGSGIFILYGLTFVPISAGQYTGGLSTTREAVFMQTGIKNDWDVVRIAAEKRVPKAAAQGAAVFAVVQRRALTIHDHTLGTWTLELPRDGSTKLSATVSWGF